MEGQIKNLLAKSVGAVEQLEGQISKLDRHLGRTPKARRNGNLQRESPIGKEISADSPVQHLSMGGDMWAGNSKQSTRTPTAGSSEALEKAILRMEKWMERREIELKNALNEEAAKRARVEDKVLLLERKGNILELQVQALLQRGTQQGTELFTTNLDQDPSAPDNYANDCSLELAVALGRVGEDMEDLKVVTRPRVKCWQ